MSLLKSVIVLLLVSLASALEPKDGLFIIQHMSHSRDAVDWGIAHKANALEMDLNFNASGYPTNLVHGFPCDCTCILDKANTVCGQLSDGCDTTADAEELLSYMATKSEIALVYIDSKMTSTDTDVETTAGAETVRLLDRVLFSNSAYAGVALINVASTKNFQFISSAYSESRSSPYASRYYFTFDGEDKDVDVAISALVSAHIENRLYSTGTTSCVFDLVDYDSTLRVAESNRRLGVIGTSFIYTVDLEDKINDYLSIPVGGILTNRPQRVYDLAVAKGFTIATPQTVIPSSYGADVQAPCDCQAELTGCKVHTAAPKGYACNCVPVICSAEVVECKHADSPLCAAPDTSFAACMQGGGSCGGYKQGCACEYKSGGCVINSAAPAHTACKCSKLPIIPSCEGDVVLCASEGADACAAPDTSAHACAQGGGNCKGYK